MLHFEQTCCCAQDSAVCTDCVVLHIQVFAMDISTQLHAYEVEFSTMCCRRRWTPPQHATTTTLSASWRLQMPVWSGRTWRLELLEQLQTAHSNMHSLEVQLHTVQNNQDKLKSHIGSLELERTALPNTVSRLRQLVPGDASFSLALYFWTEIVKNR